MSSLKSTDLFVVQRPANSEGKTDKGTYKATATQIAEFINLQSAVYFKGTANFTDDQQVPANPSNGDLWVNSDETVDGGLFAWGTHVPDGAVVDKGDQAVYSSSDSTWYILSGGGGGTGTLTGVAAGDGINIDATNAATPEVNVVVAKTSAEPVAGDENRIGGVAGIAVDTDVTPSDSVTSSPNPSFAVTADLLFATNQAIQGSIDGAITTLNGVVDLTPADRWSSTYNGSSYDGNPANLAPSIEASSTGSTRNLSVNLADTTVPGVFLAPVAADVNPDAKDVDGSPDGKLSKVHAVTPNLLFQYYTPRNFDLLNSLPS